MLRCRDGKQKYVKEREREFWGCENKKEQEWDAQKRTPAWPNVSGLLLLWLVATNR